MNRPVGVTIIAVLQFLGAAGLVLLGIAMILGGSMIGAMLTSAMGQNSQIPGGSLTGIMAGLGAVVAVVFFVFAAISALLGWGMLTLKNWARIITMVLCCIGLLFGALGLLFGLLRFSIFSLMISIIRLAINGLILWYLLQPDVKAAFEGGGRRIAATV